MGAGARGGGALSDAACAAAVAASCASANCRSSSVIPGKSSPSCEGTGKSPLAGCSEAARLSASLSKTGFFGGRSEARSFGVSTNRIGGVGEGVGRTIVSSISSGSGSFGGSSGCPRNASSKLANPAISKCSSNDTTDATTTLPLSVSPRSINQHSYRTTQFSTRKQFLGTAKPTKLIDFSTANCDRT